MPGADQDLNSIYDYIKQSAGPDRALSYVERIEAYCQTFAQFPQRGAVRDDLGPTLRIIGFEGRVTIAFHFDDATVFIDRVLYGGRDLGHAFD